MQRRKALEAGLRILEANSVPSASLAAELLLMHVLGIDRAELYTRPEAELSVEAENRYLELIGERAAGKPVQYITGHQEFWGLDLEVNADVLIPRPETELLVEAVIELAGGKARAPLEIGLRMIDVGTGSGCIALALASEFPRATIFATDLSGAALAMARMNARQLGLTARVAFAQADLLDGFAGDAAGGFDFVVSNPPYVSQDEILGLQREVRDFEPGLALGGFTRNDDIYRRLIPQAHTVLNEGGYLILEIGYSMADKIAALLGDGWGAIEIRRDLGGIPRAVAARRQ
ncbi:MAG: peptide chain release factor N(5)-glutamine methyltransferase [Terriglobia bacterium]